ncbi:hypothetical protein AMECASPLE_018082 [Ameca splendens]|uniref:Secreted protein n=1 Tax=Ameca splendens TaxID=208324 RepID=A0ABV0Z0U8_9TELE
MSHFLTVLIPFGCACSNNGRSFALCHMHVATAERKTPFLKGRNLQQHQAQCEEPSAKIEWVFEKTEHTHNTEALIHLSNTILSKVDAIHMPVTLCFICKNGIIFNYALLCVDLSHKIPNKYFQIGIVTQV